MPKPTFLLIRGGRVVDPAASADAVRDVFVSGGAIAPLNDVPAGLRGVEVIEAAGLVAAPGFVDMHVHLRDPGSTYKEDILTGAAAAAAGGFTAMACMPNTSPVADNADTLAYIAEKSRRAPVAVLPYAAVTVGQRGERLTDFAALLGAGAAAFSDDGQPVMSAAVMRAALRRADELGTFISSHCEDATLAGDRAVNAGRLSALLGLPGRPAIAEEIMIARDTLLAAENGARVHIAHVSTGRSVEIIRRAKADGVRVTAETCPHYFSLTEDEVPRLGSLARVNPPLRTGGDVAAIIVGLRDGTLDAIATDHAPHSAEEKAKPLPDAPSGMIGLETSLAVSLTSLYHTGELPLLDIVRLLSQAPARILGLPARGLSIGAPADITLFDPGEPWTVAPQLFRSKARNTPFAGSELRGRVKYTIRGGKIVYR
ncbi:MAG: dihydroorotase [Oscillospiraceae bacterium]|jgi:dihydroorotase|nr:dihydroorotase [Oscillospiraceae bacterium]